MNLLKVETGLTTYSVRFTAKEAVFITKLAEQAWGSTPDELRGIILEDEHRELINGLRDMLGR